MLTLLSELLPYILGGSPRETTLLDHTIEKVEKAFYRCFYLVVIGTIVVSMIYTRNGKSILTTIVTTAALHIGLLMLLIMMFHHLRRLARLSEMGDNGLMSQTRQVADSPLESDVNGRSLRKNGAPEEDQVEVVGKADGMQSNENTLDFRVIKSRVIELKSNASY